MVKAPDSSSGQLWREFDPDVFFGNPNSVGTETKKIKFDVDEI